MLPALVLLLGGRGAGQEPAPQEAAQRRPNLLLFLTDDQSWFSVGAEGDESVETPAFDRLAREGVRFRHAFVAAPRCTPSRSALLTGRSIWRLGAGGLFGRTLPSRYATFPRLLAEAGYHVGWTGKGWGPGDLARGGWDALGPLGRVWNHARTSPPRAGGLVYNLDYAANFESFLAARPEGRPFFFWCGTVQPHRPFPRGSGVAAGKDPARVRVPEPLPDRAAIRSDLLDYALQVDEADRHLARMLARLAEVGELENTLVVATSDNGIAYPRAKGSLYDLGTRVPLAARWPRRVSGGRVVEDLASLCDLAPTFLEAAGVSVPAGMDGRSLLDVLTSSGGGLVDPTRDAVVCASEDEYPMRSLRTPGFLYVRNLVPDRDPSPGPRFATPDSQDPAYDAARQLAFARRPAEELYVLERDPWQLANVADDPAHAGDLARLRERLDRRLRESGDPRLEGRDPWARERERGSENSLHSSFGLGHPRGGGARGPDPRAPDPHDEEQRLRAAGDHQFDSFARTVRASRERRAPEAALAAGYRALLAAMEAERDLDAIAVWFAAGREACARAGRAARVARMHLDEGLLAARRARHEHARAALQRSVAAYEDLGDGPGAALARTELARVLALGGRAGEALPLALEAWAARELGDADALDAAAARGLLVALEALVDAPDSVQADVLERVWELALRVGGMQPSLLAPERLLSLVLALERARPDGATWSAAIERAGRADLAARPAEVLARLELQAARWGIEEGDAAEVLRRLARLDVGDGPGAPELELERSLLEALALAARGERDVFVATARAVAGGHRAAGSHAERIEVLESLIEAANRCGATPLAAALEGERAALGEPRERRPTTLRLDPRPAPGARALGLRDTVLSLESTADGLRLVDPVGERVEELEILAHPRRVVFAGWTLELRGGWVRPLRAASPEGAPADGMPEEGRLEPYGLLLPLPARGTLRLARNGAASYGLPR